MKRIILALTLISIIFSACVPLKSIQYLVPDAGDSAKFNNLTIQKSSTPFYFESNLNKLRYGSLKTRIDSSLRQTKTAVFL